MGFITSILLVGTISVFAVSTIIDSKEVSYDNETSKGSYDNVQNSIDELYKRYKDLSGEQDTIYTEEILNGADPVLGKDMIPITLEDDGTVKYANLYTPWYKYEYKRWANAVILVDSPSKTYKTGDNILEKDIESYFVWIPRYSYKIWDLGNYTGYQTLSSLKDDAATAETGSPIALRRITGNARLIDIEFGATKNDNGITVGSYHTNEAFTVFDTKGFWVGKFDAGYNQGTAGKPIEDTSEWSTESAQQNTVASNRIIVKPNIYSWRNITVGNIFNSALGYNDTLKSHMMKNTEWGAVAYLSHSAYGIGNEINVNNNESYLTGYSAAANTDQSSSLGEVGIDDTITQPYNTATGYLASTTGNITGIYDMSGGAYEYMASYRVGQNASTSDVSDSMLSTYPKYFDTYEATSNWDDYSKRKLGDATGEMGPFYYYYDKDKSIRVHNAWYADSSKFVDSTNTWFARGGSCNGGVLSGQFTFGRYAGDVYTDAGFRLVLAVA